MSYASVVLIVLLLLFGLSIIVPKYIEPWWSRRTKNKTHRLMKKAFVNLKWDIIHNANWHNKDDFKAYIIRFQNEFTPGCATEYILLNQYLDQAVEMSVEVDFKKELGI